METFFKKLPENNVIWGIFYQIWAFFFLARVTRWFFWQPVGQNFFGIKCNKSPIFGFWLIFDTIFVLLAFKMQMWASLGSHYLAALLQLYCI